MRPAVKFAALSLVYLFLYFLVTTVLHRRVTFPLSRTGSNVPATQHRCVGHVQGHTQIDENYLRTFRLLIQNLLYEPHEGKQDGSFWEPKQKMLTMVGTRRLINYELVIRAIVSEAVPGHVIETGVWRGGASFYAAAVLQTLGELGPRRVFMCDSFSGIPAPKNLEQMRGQDIDAHLQGTDIGVSEDQVIADGIALGLPIGKQTTSTVQTVPGFFNTTLQVLVSADPLMRFSVLRLDGDTYFSTMESLDVLYSRLSDGGYVIIDDYLDWKTCRAAVDHFRERDGIHDPIVVVEHSSGDILRGVFWRKLAPPCVALGKSQLAPFHSTDSTRWPADEVRNLHMCIGSR